MADGGVVCERKSRTCKLGLLQDPSFTGDVGGFKINHRKSVVRIRKASIRSNFLDVKAVSRSSAKSEVISLDAGLRMEGLTT